MAEAFAREQRQHLVDAAGSQDTSRPPEVCGSVSSTRWVSA
jgi:hypothetical protein